MSFFPQCRICLDSHPRQAKPNAPYFRIGLSMWKSYKSLFDKFSSFVTQSVRIKLFVEINLSFLFFFCFQICSKWKSIIIERHTVEDHPILRQFSVCACPLTAQLCISSTTPSTHRTQTNQTSQHGVWCKNINWSVILFKCLQTQFVIGHNSGHSINSGRTPLVDIS